MWLNETLKIKYPLIQGGMANIATGAFAAAVSNAGGLGLIAGGGMSPEMLRENIREAKRLTDKPFGVNLIASSSSVIYFIFVYLSNISISFYSLFSFRGHSLKLVYFFKCL